MTNFRASGPTCKELIDSSHLRGRARERVVVVGEAAEEVEEM